MPPLISIRFIEHIITRIHARYPILSKREITIIVKTFFEVLRDDLIEKNDISINSFFSHMKLIFFSTYVNGKRFRRSVRVRLSTPENLKQ